MKDKDNNKTSIEGLGVWNDPELEARLVAMLMGELSPFEEDEMKQELEKSPELRLFRDRMLEVQGLISEVNEQEDDASDEENEGEWKLSPKRKEGLMETFANKEVAVEVDDVIEEDNEEILDDVVSSAGIQWRSFVGVAACLLISLGAFIMMFMRRGEVFKNADELVSYRVSPMDLEDSDLSLESVNVSEPRLRQEVELNEDHNWLSSNIGGEKLDKPASPSASMSKVIGANTSDIAIPIPAETAVEPSLDFGNGIDFGDGWGGTITQYDAVINGKLQEQGIVSNGERSGDFGINVDSIDSSLNIPSAKQSDDPFADAGPATNESTLSQYSLSATGNGVVVDSNGLVQAEITRRESKIVESDKALLDGRKAYQKKNYEQAVTKYKEALSKLPAGAKNDERRDSYTGHLLDGSIALSTEYHRTGKYAKARELIEGVLEEDPGNVVARKHLEYLDDPIRTSPTITYEHTKDVEKVRRNLYKAQSYYDQAQFDEAYLEYQEVLRTDPYNKAARRGMENVDRARMDYYRAAYDQTRAAMLREVDAAWEIPKPMNAREEGLLANEATGGLKKDLSLLSDADFEDHGIRNKLGEITLPLVDLDEESTVKDALYFLTQRANELDSLDTDPAKKGLKIITRDLSIPELEEIDGIASLDEINIGAMNLQNIPLHEALRQVCQAAGLRYKVEGDSVVVMRATSIEDDDLYTRTFRVSSDFLEIMAESIEDGIVLDDPFVSAPIDDGIENEGREKTLKELLELTGIKFPEGSAVGFDKDNSTLTVRNSASILDHVEELVEDIARQELERSKLKQVANFSKEISASEQTHSTFSLNVSDVSYQLVKTGLLEGGEMPKSEKIRVEEFVNAFDYGDPNVDVASGQKVNCVVEQVAHPFYQQRNLMRIGMKTGALGRSQPLRLTVLLDNSGSMERADRAATVYRAMETLAAQLGPEDEVTLLSFARDARMVAQKVKGDESQKLAEIVKQIPSEGGTNLSLAIQQAYATALQSVEDGAMSRVVLITDGAANLGDSDPEVLAQKIEQMRQSGIAFDACGVGGDGLDDEMLEALTRKGDGRYYFINKAEDADKDFAQKLAGALRPAAQNVKVQVVFNPDRVGKYRLVGFEKHRLEKKDFRNDAVDAAEMAAEECGNALYQVEAKPNGTGSVGSIFVRFRDMSTGKMIERSWDIPYQPNIHNIHNAKPSMQLATLAGMLGELLKYGEQSGVVLDQLRPLYGKLRSEYQSDTEVKDLIRMCEKMSR